MLMNVLTGVHVRRRVAAVALAWAVATTSVAAWVSTPSSFPLLVAEAELIVRAHVTDIRAVIDPELGVESLITVAVDRALKGETDGFVSFRVPGGTVGRTQVVMT